MYALLLRIVEGWGSGDCVAKAAVQLFGNRRVRDMLSRRSRAMRSARGSFDVAAPGSLRLHERNARVSR